MTGPAVNHSGRMDLQKTEALGANYAGGNSHLIALSKNEPFSILTILILIGYGPYGRRHLVGEISLTQIG